MLCIRRQTGKELVEKTLRKYTLLSSTESHLNSPRLRDSWRMEAGQRKTFQVSRREVWKRMNSDKVRGVHTQLRRFQGLYPSEEYRDYLQYMEAKVYKDLMGDMGRSMAAAFFGDKGTKIALDNDSTVGERNSRLEEAGLSWQMGLIDTQGQFDAMAAKNPLSYQGDVAFLGHRVLTWFLLGKQRNRWMLLCKHTEPENSKETSSYRPSGSNERLLRGRKSTRSVRRERSE